MIDNKINLKIDSSIYSKEGIVKCLYWYSDDFEIDVELVNNNYQISLQPLTELPKEEIERIRTKVKRELLDFNLREIVKRQTTTIRELIIAKAFSNGEFDEEPKGDLMDPLGIKFL